jgi:uncharacterized membrane protein YfcA
MNIHPDIASSTSSFMVLFTSSATFLQYLIAGKIPWFKKKI